jgi:hypothetical protein
LRCGRYSRVAEEELEREKYATDGREEPVGTVKGL